MHAKGSRAGLVLMYLLLLVVLFNGCNPLPIASRADVTATSISETQVRLHAYMKRHRDYPASLAVLPKRTGYANRTKDGWGHELVYSVDSSGNITLESLGRDGKEGGHGDNADVIKMFRTRNDDGTWTIDDDNWLMTSEIMHAPNGEKAGHAVK